MNSDACRPIYRWKALNLYFPATQRRFAPSIICSLDSVGELELFGGMKIRLIRTWREGEQERGNRRAETAQLSSTSWSGYLSRYPEWCSLCAACGEKANNVHQMSATRQNMHLPSQTNQTKTRISPSSSLFPSNESSASAFSTCQTGCRRSLAE